MRYITLIVCAALVFGCTTKPEFTEPALEFNSVEFCDEVDSYIVNFVKSFETSENIAFGVFVEKSNSDTLVLKLEHFFTKRDLQDKKCIIGVKTINGTSVFFGVNTDIFKLKPSVDLSKFEVFQSLPDSEITRTVNLNIPIVELMYTREQLFTREVKSSQKLHRSSVKLD